MRAHRVKIGYERRSNTTPVSVLTVAGSLTTFLSARIGV